jgi:hypothetical protein
VKKSKPKAPPSDARAELAEMIAMKAELVAKADSLHAAAMKLEAKRVAAVPIEAELRSLDSTEREKMADWAKAGDSSDGAPKQDTAKRKRLDRALTVSRAAASAATAAQVAVLAEHAAVLQRIASLADPIDAAIARIVAEACGPLMAEFDTLNRKLAAKGVRLRQAHEMVLATLDKVRGTEPGRTVSFNLEELHAKLKMLFTVPAQDDDAASQSLTAWRAFADGLRDNANLKLDAKARDSAPAPEVDIGAIIAKRNAALAAKGR